MAIIEIKVPVLPESVADATIATWYKKPGEFVKRDEHLLDIETDKVVLEVVAPEDGSLDSIQKNKGDTVHAEEIVALFKTGVDKELKTGVDKDQKVTAEKKPEERKESQSGTSTAPLSPSVRRLMTEKGIDANQVVGSGKDGRVTTSDVESHAAKLKAASEVLDSKTKSTAKNNEKTSSSEPVHFPEGARVEKRVPMTRLRARIAERLLQAQQNAAILTTFNEINMQPVMTLRNKYKESFEKAYGVRLGFMSFFTMATVEALKHFPVINASTDGEDIIYHGYYDIGIAVSSPRGLVVPVIRNAETLTMAEIEQQIADYGNKAKAGQLSIEDITGGTFTVSNGGVFGSLMSTPILNPPQSAILGMHKIQERPVVENGQIVIRPMMYVALSYDHRIIDGADSVRFLVSIKELLEDPARLALGI